MIKVTFPDGSVREFAKGITGLQLAESISSRLAQEVLAITVNEQIWDLSRPIETDAAIKLHKWDDEEAKHAYWHSSAHLMAEALQELYPGIKFGIGPAIENGLYYDVGGNAASAFQFFATDSTQHFQRGALYFDATPNADSLKPVNEFLIEDIFHLVNTLKWNK